MLQMIRIPPETSEHNNITSEISFKRIVLTAVLRTDRRDKDGERKKREWLGPG